MHKTTKIGAAIAAVVLALTSCGSDDPSAETPEPPPTDNAANSTIATTSPQPGSTPPSSEPDSAERFEVPTDNCPADAAEPLADGEPIRLGTVMPLSGPLASYGTFAIGIEAYFARVNDEGGIDGRTIELVLKDDAYDPARSGPLVQEMIDKDDVLATVMQFGAPNSIAARPIHESACVPQLFVGSGAPEFADPAQHPWTSLGMFSLNGEGQLMAEYAAANTDNPTVGRIVQTSVSGDSLLASFDLAAERLGIEVVEDQRYEASAPTIDGQITSLAAANPDYIVVWGNLSSKIILELERAGYPGVIILASSSSGVGGTFVPIAPAGDGVVTFSSLKDPTNPTDQSDPAIMQFIEDVETYTSADPLEGYAFQGYHVASVVAEALRQAAESDGGLSRVTLMNAAWNLDFVAPLATGGRFVMSGPVDPTGLEFAAVVVYDADAQATKPSGETFDLEGQTVN